MLNEVQIAALETVAKLADDDERRAYEERRYGDADRAGDAREWCRGRIEENAREVAPALDRDEQAMVDTWNKVLP